MTTFRFLLPAFLVLSACQGDTEDIAAQREAAREITRNNRAVEAGPVIRDTALPARYQGLSIAPAEEVAAAIDAIPVMARRIRTAEAIDTIDVLVAPEPIVIGPGARGDLQFNNTAPLETIQNAVEGSSLAYRRVRSRGVIVADIVAATLEGTDLRVYLAAP